MKTQTKTILDAALRLPETERAGLVEILAATLDLEDDPWVEAAWADVVRRRGEELLAGRVVAIPWSEVRKAARKTLRGSSSAASRAT